MTKYYTTTTEYNCGIDLHARQGASAIRYTFGFGRPELRFRPWNGPQSELRPTAPHRKGNESQMRPARQMYACVMDRQGKVLLHTNIQGNDFDYFLKRVEPYRHDLTVVCECTFNWYRLADPMNPPSRMNGRDQGATQSLLGRHGTSRPRL